MQRTKPLSGSNDMLDTINDEFAAWQKANHDAGECRDNATQCSHCQADEEARHYQAVTFKAIDRCFEDQIKALNFVFDRIFRRKA